MEHAEFSDLPAPTTALLYVGGKARPYIPAKVYSVSIAETTCTCGYHLAFTGRGEGGKSSDIHKKKRWYWICRSCETQYCLPRPPRIYAPDFFSVV